MIKDIIENPPHDAIEDLECAQVSVSDDDNTYTLDLPKKKPSQKFIKKILMKSVWYMMKLLYVLHLVMRFWKILLLVIFLKLGLLSMIIVNMRMDITRSII